MAQMDSALTLEMANKTITDLKKEVCRLSGELMEKNALVSKLMDVASNQSKRLSSFGATILHDTVAWDKSACTHPFLYSTPRQTLVEEEGSNRGPTAHAVEYGDVTTSLRLSNRYALLAPVSPVPAPGVAAEATPNLDSSLDFPALPGSDQDVCPLPVMAEARLSRAVTSSAPDVAPAPPVLSRIQRTTTSTRRKLLEEAVRRRSGSVSSAPPHESMPPCLQRIETSAETPVDAPQLDNSHTAQQQPNSPTLDARSSFPAAPHCPSGARSPSPIVQSLSSSRICSPSVPRPLFSQSTLVIGDSIIRDVRFFNAITYCIPGATVPVLLKKLPDLLLSIPDTIYRVIVHVGSNDTTQQTSETTKKQFKELFSLLRSHGLSVFISGPIPTLNRGDNRFSRILHLNTWLQHVCRSYCFTFIDNFNLFWRRSSLFKSDGLHPNRQGSNMLAANLRYSVQTAYTHD